MQKTNQEVKVTQIVVRMPSTLRRLIEEHLRRDTHMDLSEFTRDALREKLAREAPDLYRAIFSRE